MSYFNKLFGIYEDEKDKFLYFFGLKFRYIFESQRNKIDRHIMREELEIFKESIIKGVQRSITTALLHQKTFSEFKNKFVGKTVVLIGAGPTLKYFEPMEDVIYVGVNRTFLYDKVNFDYLFAIDRVGLDTGSECYYDGFLNYRGNDCIKFVGDQNCGENWQIPEGKLFNANIRRYKSTSHLVPDKFTLDIDSEPLGNFWTVSMQAMQFILYTNPSKVYIVGMDCNINSAGHFTGKVASVHMRGTSISKSDQKNIETWNGLKEFAQIYYPDTEIISVNPVGLKGVFKDIYTEQYLEELKSKEKV